MRHNSRSRRGSVAVLVAVSLTVLLGVVAISVEGGLMMDNRRHAQAAADAAALAAATDLYANYRVNQGADIGGTARASALATAAAQGFPDDGATASVAVHIPPQSGPFAGQPGYAEVLIEYRQKRAFSQIFGSGDLPVRARAVARGRWSTFNNGILLLDPAGRGSLRAAGNGRLSVTGASVIVDSSDPQAVIANGNGSLAAPEFDITGQPGVTTTGNGAMAGAVHAGVPPTPDPLRYLPPPDPATLPVQSAQGMHISGKQTATLRPGVYVGGIGIAGQATVTMLPGIYYMQGGGFSVSGPASVTGNGVMIYNAPVHNGDAVSITGQGAVTITPPTTGLYQGISIFQDRAASTPVKIAGHGDLSITGTFYAAHASLNITGDGALNEIGSQYISYDLFLAGNGDITIDWVNNPTARARVIQLVE